MARGQLQVLIASTSKWQATASNIYSAGRGAAQTFVNSAGISCLYFWNRCSFNAWYSTSYEYSSGMTTCKGKSEWVHRGKWYLSVSTLDGCSSYR